MVNDEKFQDEVIEPPPLDEAWWQAILSDGGQRYNQTLADYSIYQIADGECSQEEDESITKHTDWDKAVKYFDLDETIQMTATGFNRGGLLVSGKGISGFVPISHLIHIDQTDISIRDKLQKYTNQSLHLKIIECDPSRERVVLSERAAQSEPGTRRKLLETLKTGDCIVGRVTNIKDFGIFVDLGGIEGLIHVSEISWGRVQHPIEVVTLEQKIEVYIISVDLDRARVALSLKRLNPNPWLSVHKKYRPGQITEVVITNLAPFGAFARLENGLDGLIHISEMGTDESISHPRELCKQGQKMKVRILQIDGTKQRLALSMNLEDDI